MALKKNSLSCGVRVSATASILFGLFVLSVTCRAESVVDTPTAAVTPDAGERLPNQQQRLGVGSASGELHEHQRLSANDVVSGAPEHSLDTHDDAHEKHVKKHHKVVADTALVSDADHPKKHHKKHHKEVP